ncbi:MAG: DNA alkylation repair protein [Minicystis sp.]
MEPPSSACSGQRRCSSAGGNQGAEALESPCPARKQYSAILCQLRFNEKTDLPLLYRTIEPSLASKELFLRKAIGWALRQHAWTDPAEVQCYPIAFTPRSQRPWLPPRPLLPCGSPEGRSRSAPRAGGLATRGA